MLLRDTGIIQVLELAEWAYTKKTLTGLFCNSSISLLDDDPFGSPLVYYLAGLVGLKLPHQTWSKSISV